MSFESPHEGKKSAELIDDVKAYRDKIQVLHTDTAAQWVEYRRNVPKDLGSNPSECHIIIFFRCVLSFSATLAKRLKVQFRLGLAKNSSQYQHYGYPFIDIAHVHIVCNRNEGYH